MGRAQAAYRSSLDRSCGLDRFGTQTFFDDGKVFRVQRADAAGAGELLPASACAAPPSSIEENSRDADREVVLPELWYHLPKEEQIRFGGCFSRMILKILNRCDGLSRENGT
jgi:hypothetical protein